MSFGQELKDFVGAFSKTGKYLNDAELTRSQVKYLDAKTKKLNAPDPVSGAFKSGVDAMPESGYGAAPDKSPAKAPRQAIPDTADTPARSDVDDYADRAGGPADARGMLDAGNVDLLNRPRVKNPDGSISTVRSMSFGEGDHETLVPTVSDDGRIMSNDEAVSNYERTGKHLGKFKTPADADRFANELHEEQAKRYLPGEQSNAAPDDGGADDPNETMTYLIGKTGDPKIAAALFGNAMQESGLNPTAMGDAQAGGSFGLYQFNANGRKPEFDKWVKQNKRDPNTSDAQHDFVLYDLQTNFPKVWKAMQNAPDAQEASDIFMTGYERPNPKYAKGDARRKHAAEAFQMFSKPNKNAARPARGAIPDEG